MSLLTSLLVLIVSARLLGQLFERFKQPAIVGEMIAGLILGPSVLGLIQSGEAISAISQLAVFLVILSAGLEMNFQDVMGVLRGRGLIVGLSGFLIPFAAGVGVGIAFQLDLMRTLFLGICISITALPVAVRILQNFKLLKGDIAKYSIASAIFSDVAALLILGVILNLPDEKSLSAIGGAIFWTGSKLFLLAAVVLTINYLLERSLKRGLRVDRLMERFVEKFGNEAVFGLVAFFVLLFGSLSEALGFHFVIGAFFGALLLDRKFFPAARYKDLEGTLASITGGFLAPVFFAGIGLELNFGAISSTGLLLTVILVSVVSKVFSGWLGSRLIGLSQQTSIGIGMVLNARGVMELVVASIAYDRGFIGQGLFSILVLMGVFTTLITPILLKRAI